MALRLSELLERIRPAGAPGASGEGEARRADDARARELGDIAALLASFEAEAAGIVATAHAEAERTVADARSRAREIRAAIPDAVAVAEAEAVSVHEDEGAGAAAAIVRDANDLIGRRRAAADELIPVLVARAIDVIRAAPDPKPRGSTP